MALEFYCRTPACFSTAELHNVQLHLKLGRNAARRQSCRFVVILALQTHSSALQRASERSVCVQMLTHENSHTFPPWRKKSDRECRRPSSIGHVASARYELTKTWVVAGWKGLLHAVSTVQGRLLARSGLSVQFPSTPLANCHSTNISHQLTPSLGAFSTNTRCT